MARTHSVAARRGNPKRPDAVLTCQTCHQPIEIGQPYKWFKMKLARGGVKKSYHPGCSIPPSHRTTSRMGVIYDAQADLDFSGCESEEDCRAELESFAQTVREVGEEYTESASNIEEGFGHSTFQSEELTERAEALESWADELESWSPDAEEPDEIDEPDKTEEENEEAREEAKEAYLEALREEAQSAADECPV